MTHPLSFNPHERLVFLFADHGVTEARLNVRNFGASCCAFKVKTTTPDRYLVKPNHGLIHPNRADEISIVVAEMKKTGILARAKLDSRIHCTDKFLVQSAIIDPLLASQLEGQTSSERADAITRLLNKRGKNELGAKKMLVHFTYPELDCDYEHTNLEAEKESVKKLSLETATLAPIPGNPEAMFSEIVALRKKYDDLVEFAVRLTAERDSLSTELQNAKDTVQDATVKPELLRRESMGRAPTLHRLQLLATASLAFFLGHLIAQFSGQT